MKLIRAAFHNFRLLRNLRLDFARDENQPLTVIRAENETGKTTILTALQWAFYGDEALPGNGRDFRLHPIDWDAAQGNRVSIVVEIEFEALTFRHGRRQTLEIKRRYRIIRSVEETLHGTSSTRGPSTVKLFHVTDAGDDPVDPPEAHIHEELPPDLRDIFFTDGDRALRFIEATVNTSTKRDRVQSAIRSLLGLGVIKDALKHIKVATTDINKAARRIDTDEQFTAVMTRLTDIGEEVQRLQDETAKTKQQLARLDDALAENQKHIDTTLVKGDRVELKHEIDKADCHLKKLHNQQQTAAKEHAELFRSLSLSRDLLAPLLTTVFARLNELRDTGQIPNTTIPVLEDRLGYSTCICGESLDEAQPVGQQRRRHIQQLITASRSADELQGIITDLYYGSAPLRSERLPDTERWLHAYARIADRREELDQLAVEYGKTRSALDARLQEIRDSGLHDLRDTQRTYLDQRDRLHATQSRCETRLEGLRNEQRVLFRQRDNLLREREKGALILAQLEVTQDIEHVLNAAYERIAGEELAKVSDSMNAIFLQMIGSDPEQGAIIKEARISADFDIIVYGPTGRLLNPDRDLNGASRRALTIAFILALTRVSAVEAPNVIDTPLGMMSGYVKRSVLKTAIFESAQLILFLTRSEIADCDDILDGSAGRVITLTNTAHYPRMLANDPGVPERTVLRCDCDHRTECSQCRRMPDDEWTTADNARILPS